MRPAVTAAREARGMKTSKFLPALAGHLNPGETAFLVGSTDTWIPAADSYVLTTQRLLVMMGKNISKSHTWQEIAGFTFAPEKRGIKVFPRSEDPYNINRMKPDDHAALQAALEVFPTMGPGSAAWKAWGERRVALATPGFVQPQPGPSIPILPSSGPTAAPSPAMPLSPAPMPVSHAQVQHTASASKLDTAEPAASAPPVPDRAEFLSQLSSLRVHGVLTDDEYAAAVARLLGGEQATPSRRERPSNSSPATIRGRCHSVEVTLPVCGGLIGEVHGWRERG